MPNFTIYKNAKHYRSVNATGNLQALCTALTLSGVPGFPMHAYRGLLLAKVDQDIYGIFDAHSPPGDDVLDMIIEQKNYPMPFASAVDQLTIANQQEPAELKHVV